MARRRRSDWPGTDELLFVPLGGAGEIGMNLNLYGHDGAWVMLDLGVSFADEHLPGIDLVMPDPTFIAERREDLLGLVLTHAHEDHIGAVAHLWPRLRCPVYATPFTAALVRRKLDEMELTDEVELHVVPLGGNVKLGPFDMTYVTLTHSILEPNALAIRTPLGTVLHTGDWKLDPEPMLGDVTDVAALKGLGEEGVLAMVCDSTNVFSPGRSGSEAEVRESLMKIVGGMRGRVAITTFASNVSRLATVAEVAQTHDRHLVLVGRSMRRTVAAARETGYLQDLPRLLNEDEAGWVPPDKVLYLVTGSQGEPRGAMARIASGDHPHINLGRGDSVIFSSKIIPGNERPIGIVQNQLALAGVEVITEKSHFVHVSGHPNRDELADMYRWVRPRIAVPVHGEMRHLFEHARFARSLQVPEAPVVSNGDVLRLAPGRPEIVDRVASGRLVLDGNRLVPDDSRGVVERRRLSFGGHISVAVVVDGHGRLAAPPSAVASGLPDLGDDGLIEETVGSAVGDAVAKLDPRSRADDAAVEDAARRAARRAVSGLTGKKPVCQIQVVRLAPKAGKAARDGREGDRA
jgi:ribonuclease J